MYLLGDCHNILSECPDLRFRTDSEQPFLPASHNYFSPQMKNFYKPCIHSQNV